MVIWTQTQQQNNWANYSTKPHMLQVQWSAKSSARRRDALSWGKSCENNTHHKSYTVCSTGERETLNWKPEDFTPCFKSCFPTETMIFEGKRPSRKMFILNETNFSLRVILMELYFFVNGFGICNTLLAGPDCSLQYPGNNINSRTGTWMKAGFFSLFILPPLCHLHLTTPSKGEHLCTKDSGKDVHPKSSPCWHTHTNTYTETAALLGFSHHLCLRSFWILYLSYRPESQAYST